jgi:SSS family solute:Na+ symporter
MQFHWLDWLVVALYAAAVAALGLAGGRSRGSDDFLLAGRSLTVPAFVAALVSTWYGGILGVGEFSYLYGLVNWVVFGVPYYIFAAVFALFFARRVRESAVYSIPDTLSRAFGRRIGAIGAAAVFFISTPAPYILMQTVLLQVVTGWPTAVCMPAGIALSLLYQLRGGFRSVVRVDLLHFTLMFAGFGMLVAILAARYGGWHTLAAALPPAHLTPLGGRSWQYALVWFFIALWTIVSPQFHQFTLSARTPSVARRGIAVSIGFWMLFDGLTTAAGLYARVLLPQLGNPVMAYPLLADAVLPAVAKGLFFVAMLATVLSTTDGLTLISAVTVGRDMLARNADADLTRSTRVGIGLTIAVGAAAALAIPSVIRLWYVVGTLFIPVLLLPVVSAYYPRLRVGRTWTAAAMLSGFLASFAAFLAGVAASGADAPSYPLGIEPFYLGVASSAACYALGRLLPRRDAAAR